jgi:hypothetical protein
MSQDSEPKEPTATWNPARGAWETTTVSLLCEHSELYSQAWPTQGSMRNGQAFARPTQAPPTAGSASSSSPGLPTPRARDWKRLGKDGLEELLLLKTPTSQLAVNGGSQHPDKRKAGGHGPTLADEVEHLLPTPTATPCGNNQSPSAGAAVRPSLNSLASSGSLLPTPRASDGSKGGPNQRGSSGDLTLPSAAVRIGAPTDPPSPGGKPSQDTLPLFPLSPDETDSLA